MKPFLIWVFLFALLGIDMQSFGQGVKGAVIDQDGKPLPFATIFVKETGSGSISNERGLYEIKLEPGQYNITFQFLGYRSEAIQINVSAEVLVRDIVLEQQAYLLGTAEISGGSEDPAYKIMRKAIAKSSYHRQQVDSYTCEVYLKGGGRLVDAPWFAMKMLKDEGIDTSATFVTESVSEITYTRPGKYDERVVSMRTTGDDQDSNPMNYINSSLYEPVVAGGLISPFSPKAFAYYRFRFIRSFIDRGYTVNEISVIPRSRGEDVFQGKIFVVDDLWCIHSAALKVQIQEIEIDINQVFAPVEPQVWLPVSHNYEGRGKFLGFKFEFQYLAVVRNYDVKLNPDLNIPLTVIDSKTELPEATPPSKSTSRINLEEKLSSGEELTDKELRKLMRDYEKEERKADKEPEVIESRDIVIDSTAAKLDSTYWMNIRPVPLTQREIKGYNLMDSLATEAQKKREGDTLNTGKGKFRIYDLAMGNTYDLKKGNYLTIKPLFTTLRFNTVDGWNMEYRLSYIKRIDKNRRFEIAPLFRYGFSREKAMGILAMEYNWGESLKKSRLRLEGGSYYSQFNSEEPIATFTNSISTLFFENNFMKVYDQQFLKLSSRYKPFHNIEFSPSATYQERIETFNNTSQTWIPIEDKSYTSNRPVSDELPDTGFDRSKAFLARLEMVYSPGTRYTRRGNTYYKANRPPSITLTYTKAIPGVWESTIDYDLVSLEFKHYFDFNLLGNVDFRVEGGKFLRSDRIDFMDFRHFMGNETAFTRNAQMRGYSIMPYYQYSTQQEYLSAYFNYEFRQFIFTNIRALRLTGVKENINFNYLATPSARNYFELSYSVDNIFRFFRVDFTTSFEGGRYRDFLIQVGITSDFIQLD